jgi:xanthine dehydrogenase YagR molybdenum-binding subunit
MIMAIDVADAEVVAGVLTIISADHAPVLPEGDDGELRLFQSHEVAYRGQIVAAVVATSLEAAVEAVGLVRIRYDEAPADVLLRTDHPRLYAPEHVNPDFATDTTVGDVEAQLAQADVVVDATYTTPGEHNNPMEPHATIAVWDAGRLTLYDSVQGSQRARRAVAAALGIDPDDVRVVYQFVGGGFGSKGSSRPQAIVAALAAREVDRPVVCVVSRAQMFTMTGYRTPTIQRVQLGATADGRLTATAHDVWEQTSTIAEFAEQTAVATRHMYAAPGRRTTHRLVALDVPTPAWMRAPGECPGMFALESAMDELATACAIDPVELRIINEPDLDPETGTPLGDRRLVQCLRDGARRFSWAERRGRGPQRDGAWLSGVGVASSVYPARAQPSSARATAYPDGRWLVEIDAADIGTGSRTALLGYAAECLAVSADRVELRIADSALPAAMIAGGSMGAASWTWAIGKACAELQQRLDRSDGSIPALGIAVEVSTKDEVAALPDVSRFSFGAQFVEVRVNTDTGETRVPHMLGVFSAGRILNPVMARSQLIGGMTMGLSMALMEEAILDVELGYVVNHDLAQYHIATHADVPSIEVHVLDGGRSDLGRAGAQGVGEVGIVGAAAAVANAVHHATGIRVRDLPIRLDRLLPC